MKKSLLLFFTLLLFAVPIFGQSTPSNSVTVTVVAVPAGAVITVAPLSYYAATPATMTLTATGSIVGSACTATWDSTNLTLTFTAPGTFKASVTAAMATIGTHAVVLSCPLPVLTLNTPVTLPNAVNGVSYSANLKTLSGLAGGIPPYSFSLVSGSLPTGLSLSSAGVVSGTPSGAGSFSFGYTVTDSSGLAFNRSTILITSGG